MENSAGSGSGAHEAMAGRGMGRTFSGVPDRRAGLLIHSIIPGVVPREVFVLLAQTGPNQRRVAR